jgi:hypothetical protein
VALPILVDFEVKMDQVLQDTEVELKDDARLALIAEAVKTYSTYRPIEVPLRVDGDDGYTYDLPDEWEDGFSSILSIEYPAGEQVPVILDPLTYQLYRDDTGLHLRFLADSPGATEEFILTYTVRHNVEVDEGTIPESDFDAVVNLATSLACSAIGRKYTQDAGGSTIAVGSEQWRSVIRYTEKSRELMDLFLKHMGVGKEVGPALAFGTMVGVSSWGSTR